MTRDQHVRVQPQIKGVLMSIQQPVAVGSAAPAVINEYLLAEDLQDAFGHAQIGEIVAIFADMPDYISSRIIIAAMIVITRNEISSKPAARVGVNDIIQYLIMAMPKTAVCGAIVHAVKLREVSSMNGKLTVSAPGLCISGPQMGYLLLFAAQVRVTYQQEVEPFGPVPARLIPLPVVILGMAGHITTLRVPQVIAPK